MKVETCPICSSKLRENSWYEDQWGCVENVVACSVDDQHFYSNWSYGNQELRVSGRSLFFRTYHEDEKRIERICNIFKRRIKMILERKSVQK